MAVDEELGKGLRLLEVLVPGICDQLVEALDHGLEPDRMNSVLGFFEADETPVLGVMEDRQQCKDSQGSIRDHPGAEGRAVTHFKIYSVFPVLLILVDGQACDSRNQRGKIGGDVGQDAFWSLLGRGLCLDARQDGCEIASIRLQLYGREDWARLPQRSRIQLQEAPGSHLGLQGIEMRKLGTGDS